MFHVEHFFRRCFSLKRKIRIITVNHKKFAWWYSFNHGTEIHLSPEQDKTAVITVRFPLQNAGHPGFFAFPLWISMQKQNQFCRVKLLEPNMISILLNYLQNHFRTRTLLSFDGSALLSEMGWQMITIQNGFDW